MQINLKYEIKVIEVTKTDYFKIMRKYLRKCRIHDKTVKNNLWVLTTMTKSLSIIVGFRNSIVSLNAVVFRFCDVQFLLTIFL